MVSIKNLKKYYIILCINSSQPVGLDLFRGSNNYFTGAAYQRFILRFITATSQLWNNKNNVMAEGYHNMNCIKGSQGEEDWDPLVYILWGNILSWGLKQGHLSPLLYCLSEYSKREQSHHSFQMDVVVCLANTRGLGIWLSTKAPLQAGQPVYRLKGQHRTLEELEEAEGEARQEENLRIKIC